MGYKDLGPNVSQTPADIASGNAYSGEEKAFEGVVILEDKPVIDWEMNLRSEVSADHGWRLSNQRQSPSCFLVADALERSDVLGSYSMLAAVGGNENRFRLRAVDAMINGWTLRIEYSDTTDPGFNDVILNAAPAGGVRFDLVILEVWRALVEATPSTANKSPTSLILRHGNVKAPDGVNFSDDLLDPNFAQESSARVQIQYRLRVIDGVDVDTYPDGLDDPTVVAHSVSDFGGPGADGTATVLTYSPVDGDPGLWTAGAGDAADAATLGTVDGLMYAVPVCAVARRNTASFDRSTNLNGGNLIAAGTAERPDGVFVDQVIAEDVRDLRKVCARDMTEILQKSYQQVLDNSMTTQAETSADGTAGTSVFVVEDLGLADKIGDPDGVRRYFSDRSVTETIVAKFDVGGLPVTALNFDLFSLELPWNGFPINVPALNPGANIVGVNAIRIVDTVANTDLDMLDVASPVHVVRAVMSTVITDNDRLALNFNASASSVTVYAELVIEYPTGIGTTRNMLRAHEFWTPVPGGLPAWVDSTSFTATVDATRNAVPDPVAAADDNLWWVDPGHRELAARYVTVTQSGVTFHTVAEDELLIWERLNGGPITIDDGVNAPYATTNYTANTAYTLVKLSGAAPIAAGNEVAVDYVAFRPLPPPSGAPGDSHQLFYQSAAIQTLEPPAGTHTLNLIPREVLNFLAVVSSGTGSPDDSFPFVQATSQLPVGLLPTPDFPDSALDNPSDVSLIGFGVNSGFLQIPAVIPYVPLAQDVSLFRDAPDVVTDAEGRHFWPKSDDGTSVPALYSPVSYGQQLSHPMRHKVAMPFLAELKEDFASIGRKGTLVLVVVTGWYDFSPDNGVVLEAAAGISGAGVYRVRGNMMNPNRTTP